MRSTVGEMARALRRPEYTGENRCLPCTAVNLALVALLVAVLGTVSLRLAALVLGVSLATIYLRGYLVPGTPTLTTRYLPDRVLRRFDKAPEAGSPAEPAEDADVEGILLDAGAVTDCEDGDDLCLTESFEAAWHARISSLRGNDTSRRDLAGILEVDPESLAFTEHGEAFVATRDGRRIGQWESRAAFLADVAAAKELRERHPEWAGLPIRHRSRILNGLRIFLERCPVCDGPVSLDREVVESCCRSLDVVAATCERCEARLIEAERPPPASPS